MARKKKSVGSPRVAKLLLLVFSFSAEPLVCIAAEQEEQSDQHAQKVDHEDEQTSSPSYLEIFRGISGFRSGLLDHFEETAKRLEGFKADTEKSARTQQEALAEQVRAFASTWLSLWGWSSGVTGLAKDFLWQYLGRASFHGRNGPLIDAVKACAAAIAARDRETQFPRALRQLVAQGKIVFNEPGALQSIFAELSKMGKKGDGVFETFATAADGEAVKTMAKAFRFLSTDLKSARAGEHSGGGRDGGGEEDDFDIEL
eukprot:g7355.t1